MIFLQNLMETVKLRILLTCYQDELQAEDISATFTAESAKKYITIR